MMICVLFWIQVKYCLYHAAFDPETESYKPQIDINEAFEELFLEFNLDKNEGINELKDIIIRYCEQEKENSVDIKIKLNEIIESYGFEKEALIKDNVNEILNPYNIKRKIKLK